MIRIDTKDGYSIVIASTSKVNGPNQVGGLQFGMSYVYFSTDEGKSWIKSGYRSPVQLATYVSSVGFEDLIKELGY